MVIAKVDKFWLDQQPQLHRSAVERQAIGANLLSPLVVVLFAVDAASPGEECILRLRVVFKSPQIGQMVLSQEFGSLVISMAKPEWQIGAQTCDIQRRPQSIDHSFRIANSPTLRHG
jgi:hypothetical protein